MLVSPAVADGAPVCSRPLWGRWVRCAAVSPEGVPRLEVQVQQLGQEPRLMGPGGGLPLLLWLPAPLLLWAMQPVLYLSPCQVLWLSPPSFRKLSMDPRFVCFIAGSLVSRAGGISSPLLGC